MFTRNISGTVKTQDSISVASFICNFLSWDAFYRTQINHHHCHPTSGSPWIINVAPGAILEALPSFRLRHILSAQSASARSLLSIILGDPRLHTDVSYLGKWHLKTTSGRKRAISNTFWHQPVAKSCTLSSYQWHVQFPSHLTAIVPSVKQTNSTVFRGLKEKYQRFSPLSIL